MLGGTNAAIREKQAAAGQTIVAWDLTAGREFWRHAEPCRFITGPSLSAMGGPISTAKRSGWPASMQRESWRGKITMQRGWGPSFEWRNRNGNTEAMRTLRVGNAQLRLAMMEGKNDLMFGTADGKLLWQGQPIANDFFVGDRFYRCNGAVNPATGETIEKHWFSVGGWCGIRTWVPVLQSGLGHVSFGMKSPCGVGADAAGGMLHFMSSQCSCFPLTRGAAGFAGASDIFKQIEQSPQHALEKGAAPSPAVTAVAGDWPAYRGDIRHTGATPIQAGPAPQVRWAIPPPQPFAVPPGYDVERMEWLDRPTPPVTAGGFAFLDASDGSVRAVKLAGGKPAWTYWTGGAVLTSPVVAGGRVYAGMPTGGCIASTRRPGNWCGAGAVRRRNGG